MIMANGTFCLELVGSHSDEVVQVNYQFSGGNSIVSQLTLCPCSLLVEFYL